MLAADDARQSSSAVGGRGAGDAHERAVHEPTRRPAPRPRARIIVVSIGFAVLGARPAASSTGRAGARRRAAAGRRVAVSAARAEPARGAPGRRAAVRPPSMVAVTARGGIVAATWSAWFTLGTAGVCLDRMAEPRPTRARSEPSRSDRHHEPRSAPDRNPSPCSTCPRTAPAVITDAAVMDSSARHDVTWRGSVRPHRHLDDHVRGAAKRPDPPLCDRIVRRAASVASLGCSVRATHLVVPIAVCRRCTGRPCRSSPQPTRSTDRAVARPDRGTEALRGLDPSADLHVVTSKNLGDDGPCRAEWRVCRVDELRRSALVRRAPPRPIGPTLGEAVGADDRGRRGFLDDSLPWCRRRSAGRGRRRPSTTDYARNPTIPTDRTTGP